MPLRYGAIQYGPHGHQAQSVGTVDGREVVHIRKNMNHTSTNHAIYSVLVLGQELTKRYRSIHEAREAGQREYEKMGRSDLNRLIAKDGED